jgi:metal-responsive CopG/Arc/MetJ family transcriptional regulator
VPDSNEGSARFSVTLPRRVIARLDTMAAERGLKRAELMREAAHLYLRDYDRQQQERAS